jgi:hypothetical protein
MAPIRSLRRRRYYLRPRIYRDGYGSADNCDDMEQDVDFDDDMVRDITSKDGVNEHDTAENKYMMSGALNPPDEISFSDKDVRPLDSDGDSIEDDTKSFTAAISGNEATGIDKPSRTRKSSLLRRSSEPCRSRNVGPPAPELADCFCPLSRSPAGTQPPPKDITGGATRGTETDGGNASISALTVYKAALEECVNAADRGGKDEENACFERALKARLGLQVPMKRLADSKETPRTREGT